MQETSISSSKAAQEIPISFTEEKTLRQELRKILRQEFLHTRPVWEGDSNQQ